MLSLIIIIVLNQYSMKKKNARYIYFIFENERQFFGTIGGRTRRIRYQEQHAQIYKTFFKLLKYFSCLQQK